MVRAIACGLALAAANPSARGQDHELWDKPRLRVALSILAVAPERDCSVWDVDPSAWAGRHEEIAELHLGLLSAYDGIIFPNFHYVQIEHIVARKEADESELCDRPLEAREAFAGDLLNLTFAPGALNASKGDRDAHELMAAESSIFRDSLTPHAKCWWVAQSIRVKDKYGLSVDREEKATMQSILEDCDDEHVFRPVLASRADWVFRPEFLQALPVASRVPQCSAQDSVPTVERLQLASGLASPYVSEMACLTYVVPSRRPVMETPESETGESTPPNESQPDPRAGQTEAQRACILTLEEREISKTCGNVSDVCPAVEPILEGEPLYEFLRDADRDGIVCESL